MNTECLNYKRSRFRTKLPKDRFYLKSHYWVAKEDSVLTIGMTKFSTRMLGELVDFGFEKEENAEIELGEIVGWIEGFKATSDIYSVASGYFHSFNTDIEKDPELFFRKPYEQGWLYKIKGEVDPESMDVETYASFLDQTIDHIQAQENN